MTSHAVENDLLLPEGVCFGWFSSVNAKCQAGSCMQSVRCQQYTVTMQQTSGMLDITTKTAVEKNVVRKEEAKQEASSGEPDEYVQRAYFDNVMSCLISEMKHDDVHYDPTHMWATIKKNRNVLAFIIRNKKNVRVRLGSSKETNRPEIELPIGMEIEEIKDRVVSFVKKNI
jgi:hypothetical protein